MEGDQRESGIRLAELIAAFSLATDLGFGQPMEHVLRSWLIAARMAERMGLEASARQPLYYVITLAKVGCIAETPELAQWFGDDIVFRRDGYGVDFAGLPKHAFALRHVALGSLSHGDAGTQPLRRMNGPRAPTRGFPLVTACELRCCDPRDRSATVRRALPRGRQRARNWQVGIRKNERSLRVLGRIPCMPNMTAKP